MADSIPKIFPYYVTYFEQFASKNAPLMKKPMGELINIPWGDKLESFGIQMEQDQFGSANAVIDSGQLVTGIRNILASDTLEGFAAKAVDHLSKLWQIVNESRELKDKPSESLVDIEFPPKKKSNPRNSIQVILNEKEQTINRVRIAGKFLYFMQKMDEMEHGDITKFFSEAIVATKHLDGDQASSLWKRLYQAAKLKINEHPDYMKELGFALLEDGYLKQGKDVLQVYMDTAIAELSVYTKNTFRGNYSGELLLALIEHHQLDLARDVYEKVLSQVSSTRKNYHDSLIRFYGTIEGKFTEQGKTEFEEFLSGYRDRHITAEEVHQKVRELETRKLYIFADYTNPDKLPTDQEERHFELLSELCNIARDLSEASDKLSDDHKGFAKDLRDSASLIYDLAMMGSRKKLDLRIKK